MKKENMAEKQGLTRRDFLKGTAAGALSIAAAGVLGACSSAGTTTAAAAETPADTAASAETAAETTAAPETTAPDEPATTAAAPPEGGQAAAAGGEDWLGAEPETGEISETVDYDVVIIGAGLSGICAARAAAEEGAKVAVVEKSESFNCRSGEYALLNGTLNKRWGRENIVDTDVVVDRLMRECTYRNKRPVIKRWAEHAHEVMDWFLAAYPDLTICDSTRQEVTQEQFDKGILVPLSWPQPEHYDYKEEEFPTFPSSMEFRSSRRDQQGFIVEAQLNDAIANGTQMYYGCFGTKLLKDDSGRVTGVVIRDAVNGNKYIQLNAVKGVILATGDNGSDDRIMQHFCPEILEKNIMRMGPMMGVDVEGNPISTGDGLRMGAWAGAKVQDFHAPMTHHMGGGMGVTPFLQINLHGERFMNESIPGQQLENQIELQPEHTSFQIYDSKWPEQIPYMPANHGGLCYIIPEDEDNTSNPNYNDRQYTKVSEKENAHTATGETIEELLTNLGFAGEALETAKASIERYNALAKAGKDEDFGKPAKRMFAIENGPFYATKWGTTAMLVCVGGLESDENCHTFTAGDNTASPSRERIAGLYVCGNVQGSRYAVEYPICFRGISHSLCVFYGYVAGKNCVAGV